MPGALGEDVRNETSAKRSTRVIGVRAKILLLVSQPRMGTKQARDPQHLVDVFACLLTVRLGGFGCRRLHISSFHNHAARGVRGRHSSRLMEDLHGRHGQSDHQVEEVQPASMLSRRMLSRCASRPSCAPFPSRSPAILLPVRPKMTCLSCCAAQGLTSKMACRSPGNDFVGRFCWRIVGTWPRREDSVFEPQRGWLGLGKPSVGTSRLHTPFVKYDAVAREYSTEEGRKTTKRHGATRECA